MNSQELETAWAAVIEKINTYSSVDTSQISAFFSRIHPMAMSDDFLMITADNDFIKSWVERHYLKIIVQALNEIYGKDFQVSIEVDLKEDVSPLPSPVINNISQTPISLSIEEKEKQSSGSTETPTVIKEEVSQISAAPDFSFSDSEDNPINAFTFENFVIGDSNRMAYSMAVAVAEEPGKAHLNPLFIYGKSGLGKTHLLRAIQNYLHDSLPLMKVVYADSAEFLNEFVEAAISSDKQKQSYKNFKDRYEAADVLLIDDVQYFQGKQQTLEIVFQLFNNLTSQGKQVIFSADRAPKNIDIDERYLSRFSQGGIVDIQPPEMETKIGIIRNYIEDYKKSEGVSDFYLSKEVQSYIAEISSSNIRELKGAVTRIIYQSLYTNQTITVDEAHTLLENHFSSGPQKRLTVADIQREVENFYKVSHTELTGPKRSRNIAHARKVAIYLCRTMLDVPFADIGKKFNRDHSSIMYTVNNIEVKRSENRDLQEEIESLTRIIKEV